MEIIGRLEFIDLPELDLSGLEAKIDTGAYSCSLHCANIKVCDDMMVSFELLDEDHPIYHGKKFNFKIHEIKNVKSSNGEVQERVFIKTNILINKKSYEIELSLTDRSSMKYPMLIGRKILENNFLVDVSKENLTNTNK